MNRRSNIHGVPYAAVVLTSIVLERKRTLLEGRLSMVIYDRATPLNLADPRPFEGALRRHMQTLFRDATSAS